ncbi:hypothetical protein EGW08_014047 [Elysia chlorotica]|uniref:SEA domain-containing protein n=1 Tax=Elysia chlorotica TaxID=188477 RepID=A0A433T9G8_ELYCH|nr:hypothetical protein EGW08_014047 [Elysia chlorotica]
MMSVQKVGKLFLLSMICTIFINVIDGATTTTSSTVSDSTTAINETTANGTATTDAVTAATTAHTTTAAPTTTAAATLPPIRTITDGYNPPRVSQALFNRLVALFGPMAAFDLIYSQRTAANNFGGSYYINHIG